ncbi:MAG TPA: SGNH/GDSL hydrolase family protein, partial [Polyangiales bacterium]|nr:SGNH/GDSL hydrolase family protein [Polyangiales bacterium]
AVELAGRVIPLAKTKDETRVLFVGDSATEGAFVSATENFPSVFQTLIDRREGGARVRAINAGVWGMTTIDEYHLLKDKLLPLTPDVVVIGLFMANDINTNLAHREWIERGGWSVWLRNHSALAHFCYLRLLALSERARFPANALVPAAFKLVDSRGLSMLSYPAGELATYLTPPSSLIDHAFDVLEHVLVDFETLGRQHHFSVRVLIIPSPSHVLGRLAILHFPDLLTELRARGVSIDPGQIDVDAPTRRVLSICARIHLTCIDPSERLARFGGRAFFPHDEHPTALAHRALAEELMAH